MADASQDRDSYSEMLYNNPDLMEAVHLLARQVPRIADVRGCTRDHGEISTCKNEKSINSSSRQWSPDSRSVDQARTASLIR
jgi:hypothetical protein